MFEYLKGTAACTLQLLLAKDASGKLPASVVAPTPVAPASIPTPVTPASIAVIVPKSRPAAKPLEDVTPKTKGRPAGKGKGKAAALPEKEAAAKQAWIVAAATELVKRKRGSPPKAQQLADVTNVEQAAEGGTVVLCDVVGNGGHDSVVGYRAAFNTSPVAYVQELFGFPSRRFESPHHRKDTP
ncbi:hypothetical protein B0H14DRAFT_3774460 [Mycena olivaceomarginata]|nr:hypothetical protein B0H14DRAFT_3774460 [Mycena olivaceomarginata]